MHFTWDKKYNVFIEDIDAQHQYYFKLANKLDDLLQNYTDKDEPKLIILFDRLLNYAFYHFSTEEEYFEECHYEETKEHIQQHNLYRKTMKEYNTKLTNTKTNKLKLGKKIHEFATTWLKEHIIHTDKRYVPTLSKCLFPHRPN